MTVVAEACSVGEAFYTLERPADVALVDYHLGKGRDGLSLIAPLKALQPAARVLVYSAFADGALAVAAMIAGADGLIGKHEFGEVLCDALRQVARGHHRIPAISQSVAGAMRARLEPQDQALFGMLLHAVAPEVITEQLGISAEQFRERRASILRSLKPTPALSALPSGA